MTMPRQSDVDREEETRKLFCSNYCRGIADAEKTRDNLMTMNYSRIMAERVVNEWAEYLQRPLPFPVTIIRGSRI